MKSLMILKRKFVLLIPIAVYTSKWKSLAEAVFFMGQTGAWVRQGPDFDPPLLIKRAK